MKTKTIPTPTPGRVVLIALTATQIRPAIVYLVGDPGDRILTQIQGPPLRCDHHEGLAYSDVTNCAENVRYGERAPGVPAPGRWCYPPMTRLEIEVEDLLSE